MPESSPASLKWSAFEHEHIERTGDWFWALGIIAACAALTSILFGNVLFALLIIVAAFVIGLIAKQPPQLHDFELTPRGIVVSGTLHSYEEVLSFWVETEDAGQPLLLIDTTKFMAPNLVIPLDSVNPETVRTFLGQYVEEVPMKEPLPHKILEFFGF